MGSSSDGKPDPYWWEKLPPYNGTPNMYFFYLGELLLPVAPEKVTVKIPNHNKTVTLLNEGEINLLKAPGLAEYQFKILLPNTPYPFAQYGYAKFLSAGYYLDKLEKLKAEKKPFQFRILRETNLYTRSRSTDIKVSLEEYSIEENAEEGFDFLVDIQLKAYREWGTKTLIIQDDTATEEPGRDPDAIKPPGKEYTIQDGDCLWSIAQRFMGDGSRYHELYLANKKVLDDEAERRGCGKEAGENNNFTGTVIYIPE